MGVTDDENSFFGKGESEPLEGDVIIIDEATHLSSFELQCIAHYCNINNTRLVLMGDNKQNGFIGRGGNLRPSGAFLWRSQNLNISLRDNNI